MFLQFGYEPDHLSIRRALSCLATTRLIPVISLMAVFVAPAFAQRDVPLTIAEAEDLALSAEPGQQALVERANALEEQAIVAGALPDPVLRLGLNNYPIESGNFSTEGMTHAAVGYRQMFPRGKTRSLDTRRYEFLASDMNQQAGARAYDVLEATRIAWLDLFYWGKAHALVTESRPFFDDLVTITRSLYAVGRSNQQDVLRAELELSRLDDRLINIERRRALARASLGRWIGTDASREVADKLPTWADPPPLEALQQTLPQHPSLQAADARIFARDNGVELAEQRSRPGWALDIGYSYREGNLPTGEPRSDFVSLGVTVDMPFFRKKSVDSTLSAALSERSAARSDKERLLRAMDSELQGVLARWQELNRRLALYEKRMLGQASDNAQASLLAYQSDDGDFADVMRGYIVDLNTRIEFVRLQVEREQSFAMLANLGGLPR